MTSVSDSLSSFLFFVNSLRELVRCKLSSIQFFKVSSKIAEPLRKCMSVEDAINLHSPLEWILKDSVTFVEQQLSNRAILSPMEKISSKHPTNDKFFTKAKIAGLKFQVKLNASQGLPKRIFCGD